MQTPANDSWPWQYADVINAGGWIYVLAAPRLWSVLRRIPPKEHVLRLVDAFAQYAYSDHCYHSIPHSASRPDPSRRGPAAARLRDLLVQWNPPEVTPAIQEAARAVLCEERIALADVPWEERGPYEDEVPVEAGLLWPEGSWNEQAFRDAGGPPPAPGKPRPPRPGPRVLRHEPMTTAEWARSDEPGELFDGVLVEEEAATPAHEAAVAWILQALRAWAEPRGAKVFGPGHKLVVSERMGMVPDACVFMARDPRDGEAVVSRTRPALVVEVLSPDPVDMARDRVQKLPAYRGAEIANVWVVDPVMHIVECFERSPDGQHLLRYVGESGTFTPPGFEGMALDLDALWAEVDRVAPSPAS
ncbi:Uma2 family endonuclease [Polyangium sp. 15x6]|uniref:Uma2 family endonuclease n=1 Tax=Polyangium sp. 15x6 TaxID=3042687 RepID=UPI00249A7117|nr:Uma2 family endonuclease [Polyangium sp. 15x6]MDI3291206.1 Uma2 family endonuclease [Polyangium sp. 15x6]